MNPGQLGNCLIGWAACILNAENLSCETPSASGFQRPGSWAGRGIG